MKYALCLLLATAALQSNAAPKTTFSCEKIKEKSLRESCIEIRNQSKENSGKENSRSQEVETFVSEAKAHLTRNFKDPSSAQFSELYYIDSKAYDSDFLCGGVNAKNSYGGYVGVKPFYVRRVKRADSDGSLLSWIPKDIDSSATSSQLKLEMVLSEQAMSFCGEKSGEHVKVK